MLGRARTNLGSAINCSPQSRMKQTFYGRLVEHIVQRYSCIFPKLIQNSLSSCPTETLGPFLSICPLGINMAGLSLPLGLMKGASTDCALPPTAETRPCACLEGFCHRNMFSFALASNASVSTVCPALHLKSLIWFQASELVFLLLVASFRSMYT